MLHPSRRLSAPAGVPDDKELRIFPGEAHGTELFDTESGDALRELLLDFLVGLH